MFDVGFMELLLIGIVALLVIGPERLPKVARTAGLWLGKGRRFISSVKSDIEQELKSEELKRILAEQAKSNPVHDIIEEVGKTTSDLKAKAGSAVGDVAKAAQSVTEPSSGSGTADPTSGAHKGAKQNDGPAKH